MFSALADLSRTSDEKFFELRIALDESSTVLRPGMTARVLIHAFKAHNILAIPIHATFQEGNRFYCYVQLPDKTFEKRTIKLGVGNEYQAEIVSGLNEGEAVSLINPFTEDL